MGNALLSFRGLEIPSIQNISPTFGWSSADGTFNNIFCNTITVANPPGPAQVPALQVVEYENSPTDFAQLDISSQPNGPFLIQTDGANRGITMHATGTLIVDGDNQLILASGTNPMQFWTGTGAGSLKWQIQTAGEFQPGVNATSNPTIGYDIGDSNFLVRNIFAQALIGGPSTPIRIIGPNGAINFQLGTGGFGWFGGSNDLMTFDINTGNIARFRATNGSFPIDIGGSGNPAQWFRYIYVMPTGVICTGTKAGIPVDADITNAPAADGMLKVDTTDNRLYVRCNGLWKYATLT